MCIVTLVTFFIFGNYNAKKEGASSASKVLFGITWILGFVFLAFFVHNSEQLGLTILAELTLLGVHILCGSTYIFMYWKRMNKEAIATVKLNKAEIERQYHERPSKLQDLSWQEWLKLKGYRPTPSDNINLLAARGMFWVWFLFLWALELIWNVLTGTGKRIYNVYQNITKAYGNALSKQSDTMWDEQDKKRK